MRGWPGLFRYLPLGREFRFNDVQNVLGIRSASSFPFSALALVAEASTPPAVDIVVSIGTTS
jgi:hypothetical protein